ncbi:hypothetical protein Pr1d_24470 [Bythopirellula goksoeyrii]|uniref:Uncharacterized protein n=1 Tax=Bythopirellula goksoeyrii TaxID=1400387 RepID=A0A5B9QDZ3_9BACT|nr:hypothetical protein Pr1d_24470 [Bythopirellula goksoeyrii]
MKRKRYTKARKHCCTYRTRLELAVEMLNV